MLNNYNLYRDTVSEMYEVYDRNSIYEDNNVYLSYIYDNTFNFGTISANIFTSQFTIELNSASSKKSSSKYSLYIPIV